MSEIDDPNVVISCDTLYYSFNWQDEDDNSYDVNLSMPMLGVTDPTYWDDAVTSIVGTIVTKTGFSVDTVAKTYAIQDNNFISTTPLTIS